jgi:hypothetical protein
MNRILKKADLNGGYAFAHATSGSSKNTRFGTDAPDKNSNILFKKSSSNSNSGSWKDVHAKFKELLEQGKVKYKGDDAPYHKDSKYHKNTEGIKGKSPKPTNPDEVIKMPCQFLRQMLLMVFVT